MAEVKKESDFVGPQPFYGTPSNFDGFHYPSEKDAPVPVNASVELKLKIDPSGNLQNLEVVTEEPPFVGFGKAAKADFAEAKFIPAFRDGKPVACEVHLPVFYQAVRPPTP